MGKPLLPYAFVWFSLFLPGIWMLGLSLARRSTRDVALARVLAPGLGVLAWLLTIHGIGLLTARFSVAFSLGTVAPSMVGMVAFWRDRRRPGLLPLGELPLGAYLGATAVTLAMSVPALSYEFFDEELVTGHMAITTQITNGVYPPRNLSFPDVELRYHYGFDVLAAVAAVLLRIPARLAVDVVTLACWFYTWILLFAWGARNLPKGWASLAPTSVLLCAGYPMFCTAASTTPASLAGHLLEVCSDGGIHNPPVYSYFFQHPWTLGIPVTCVLILVAGEENDTWWRRGSLLIGITALSISQFALFAVIGPGLALRELRTLRRPSGRVVAVVATWAALLVGLLVASRLHCFFVPGEVEFPLKETHGIAVTWRASFIWHARTMGIPLFLGLVGTLALRDGPLLALGITMSLVILNLFAYENSWDIVKFATAAQFLLGFGTAKVLGWLAGRVGSVGKGVSFVLVGAMLPGLLGFLYVLWAEIPGGHAAYRKLGRDLRPTVDEAVILQHLRRNMAPREIVLVPSHRIYTYASYGGVAQAWVDNSAGFPLAPERLTKRNNLIATLPADPARYLQQGIRYFVTDGAAVLGQRVDAWVERGSAEVVLSRGPWRLVRLHDADVAATPVP